MPDQITSVAGYDRSFAAFLLRSGGRKFHLTSALGKTTPTPSTQQQKSEIRRQKSVTFNASILVGGVYTYELNTGKFSAARKRLVVRYCVMRDSLITEGKQRLPFSFYVDSRLPLH